jgi:polar amino acid transport system permease protein
MTHFSWDWPYAISLLPRLLQGLELTVLATVLAAAAAIALALVWTLTRISRAPFLSRGAYALVLFIRGTPLLVQLFFWFYVLPLYFVSLSPLTTGILALGVYYSAYISEIYRAGMKAIPPGQWEACLVLGLPLRRIWWKIILPQVLRTITPMLATNVIVMFKETALLSTITVMEMFGQAMDVGFDRFRFVEPITIAGVLYFAVSYLAALSFRFMERRFV